jgi:hypothetical protein
VLRKKQSLERRNERPADPRTACWRSHGRRIRTLVGVEQPVPFSGRESAASV